MINVIDKVKCSGCGACYQKCPKHCISLISDNEGFWYPRVDTEICIDCGLCEKVCHELHPYEEHEPLRVYAAINKDTEIRLKSSSGGIFTLIAENIINEGGVVFGARFDEEWQVKLDYTETIDGLAAFRGSKYVQARTEKTFIQAEQFLKAGRKVLFTGTPCQIAALHHFLAKDYANLMSVDFVCHGVPSPMVWGKYLDEISALNKSTIKNIQFRDKTNGWKKFNLFISYIDSSSLLEFHGKNPYMRAFLSDLILRPSCYNCKAKHCSSKSDITIADFWGIESLHPEIDDDKGTSLVVINTTIGHSFFMNLRTEFVESELEFAIPYNKGIGCLIIAHKKRKKFFKEISRKNDIISLINSMLSISIFVRIKKKIKKIINENRNSYFTAKI